MERRCVRFLWSFLLFLSIQVAVGGVEGGLKRRLQQREEVEVEITAGNVNRLSRLVRDATRDTVFVMTVDVQLPSVIFVTTNRLTFRGAEDARPTITCADGEQGFNVNANNAVFENLIIRDCSQTAILIVDAVEECSPFDQDCVQREPRSFDTTFRSVDFINNVGTRALSAGGAMSVSEKMNVEVFSCRFENNTGISGGAISFVGDSLIIEDSIFVENTAENTGGAIAALRSEINEDDDIDVRFTTTNCNFTDNRVLRGGTDRSGLTVERLIDLESNPYIQFPLPSPSGGAIYVVDFMEVTIEGCNFNGNNAVPAGGALYLGDNGSIKVENCRFQNNYVLPPSRSTNAMDLQLGGAVFAAFANGATELEILRSTFVNNTASYGGAFHFVGPLANRVAIRTCSFTGNMATLGGGAAAFRNAEAPTLANARFVNNTAFVGGAIFVTNGGGLDMLESNSDEEASVFEDNVAFDGGAVFSIGGGILKFFRVFFRRNRSQRNGGAICYIDSKAGGALSIQDARMFNNSAEIGGAIFLENLSELFMVAGALDVNSVFLNEVDIPRNDFIDNVAVAGGAIYYRASNLVDNKFSFDRVNFISNRAVSNISLIYDEPLSFPDATRETRKLLQSSSTDESENVLLDPKSANPCYPGGGGAVCLVLSGISLRAPVSIELKLSNFTENSAMVGGATLISTQEGIEWKSRCPSSEESTASLLTSDPCRSLTLRGMRFTRNEATRAGGAILASNLKHVHYSDQQEVAERLRFQTLDMVADGDNFRNNRVSGSDGYGPTVAGTAVRLNVSSRASNSVPELLVADQASGQANPLPEIEVKVLDGLDQVISAGIVDSAFPIRASSMRAGSSASIASGQVVATSEAGVAVFDALTLTAPAATYEVAFSVRGDDSVESARGNVTIRDCGLGERYNSEEFVCENCLFETFTFFTNVSACPGCPERARCVGNASLVPTPGYWHSSPFSVIMHECFHDASCDYDRRSPQLETQRDAQLEVFLARFAEGATPVFTNDEYQQCATGYEGPLCGSCESGYGRADGKTCVRCDSKSATAAIVFLLGIWQLVVLSITIRSALISIRDMNQMMLFAQQQQAATRPSRRRLGGPSNIPASIQGTGPSHGTFGVPQNYPESETMSHRGSITPLTGGVGTNPSVPVPAAPQPTQIQQHSLDYIIAAQHASETIKIFVNFFQITSVAVNINLDWEEAVKNLLGFMNSVAGFSNGATFTPMTCLLDSDSDTRSIHGVILRIAFPMCLMAIVMVAFSITWLASRRSPTYQAGDGQEYLRSRSIICFLVVGFFSYQSISEDLMGTVSCVELDADEKAEAEGFDDPENGVNYSQFAIAGDRYWTEDTNIECFSKDHAFLVAFLGIPGIILFLFGVPFYLFVFLLFKRWRGQLAERSVLNTYGFVYQNYEEKFVYWEVFILMRKALISAIVVFAYPLGANLQGIMALGVLILSLAFHLVATPFKYFWLNVLEGSSLVVSILTFYSGVVFNDENTSRDAETFLTVALIVINALLMLIFVVTVAVYADKYVLAKLKSMDVNDIPRNPISRMLRLAREVSGQGFGVLAGKIHTIRASAANRRVRRVQTRRASQLTAMQTTGATQTTSTTPATPPQPNSDPHTAVTPGDNNVALV